MQKHVMIEHIKSHSDLRHEIVISSNGVDRDKEIIEQDGWQLDNYWKNPVVLINHVYSDIPSAKTTSLNVEKDGKRRLLVADFEFRSPANDHDPINFAISAYNEGFLQAASVGFRPIKSEAMSEDGDGESDSFWFWEPQRYLEQELLEWSLVTVPANPEATARMMKRLGSGQHIVKLPTIDSLVVTGVKTDNSDVPLTVHTSGVHPEVITLPKGATILEPIASKEILQEELLIALLEKKQLLLQRQDMKGANHGNY